jgi:hypothetical protein
MVFDRFIPEGAVFFLPETIPNWQNLTEPVPARFYSAHYCFTLGQFCEEVPHDEQYYFHGEEISIAARAFTWGFDLFHPHKVLIWHEYTRKGRIKCWDDDKDWGTKNNISHLKNRKLFGMDGESYNPKEFGKYGFGYIRTLRDYEIYSGLLFSDRSIQQYTIDKNYPPNPYNFNSEEEWKASFAQIFKHCIDVGYSQVPETDYDFWVVAFHKEDDETIYIGAVNRNKPEFNPIPLLNCFTLELTGRNHTHQALLPKRSDGSGKGERALWKRYVLPLIELKAKGRESFEGPYELVIIGENDIRRN